MANHSDAVDSTTAADREELYRQPEPEQKRSHIQALPLEIILTIFTLVVSRDHASVIILAQVFQGCCKLVVSAPNLWSTLSLSQANPQAKAMLWRPRNQGLLRALHIRDNSKEIRAALVTFSDIALDSLRFLSVTGKDMLYGTLCLLLPQLTPSVISNLRSVDLRVTDIGWSTVWSSVTSELQLRSLVTEHVPLAWFTLGDHSTKLRHLAYKRALDVQALPVLLLRRLSLPSLRFIKLHHWYPNVVGLMIQALIDIEAVARLVSIAIVHDESSYIYRVNTKLVSELLHNATLLAHLELSGIANAREVVDAITQDALCPNLATLHLSRCPDVTDKPLIALVKARNNTVPSTATSSDVVDSPAPMAKLHTLVVNSCSKVFDDGQIWLGKHVPHVARHLERTGNQTGAEEELLGEDLPWTSFTGIPLDNVPTNSR
ncbi:hypothetical protein BC835DRAFT_1424658 [Cytidiella melzeri]|nr:hypothetical protein BC835DRAFT_1424658 [Cytidiella melzeri]